MKNMKKVIVLGVTGSIAAYKAVELVRLMKKKGWDVWVLMTQAATAFVGELTFRTLSHNPVSVGMFDDIGQFNPEHITLAEKADILLIAPCTANVLAKLAHGLADDLLTSTALACEAPLVISPAMNDKMWKHPATLDNVKTLKSRGATIIDVSEGDLACGGQGRGRMAGLEEIIGVVESCLK